MSIAVICSKSKPEFQYGGRLGEFHGMSSHSHRYIAGCCHMANSMSWSHSYVSHCRVLPLGEFTVMIPEPHVTLQGEVTWRNQCHYRATLQGVIIPSAILKIVFRQNLFFKCSLGFNERRLSYRLRYTCLTLNNIVILKFRSLKVIQSSTIQKASA